MRQTRQTFVEDFSFSIYWIHPANRISFNECICRHAVQSRFGSKDYAAGHEQQTTTTCYSSFLMLKLAVFLDLEVFDQHQTHRSKLSPFFHQKHSESLAQHS
ncbi:hypothetical protein EAE99_004533 [Botrytis elliptica]|nr:hypothetical protein EAE99_004533 [Botrytis elliptica]